MSCVKALVLMAPGAEELETVTPVDILRRGEVDVTLAGVCGSEDVKCSRNTKIKPDCSLEDAMCKGPFDIIVLPGGLGGAKILRDSKLVGKVLKEQELACRYIAAICAGPTALKAHCIGVGRKLTSYPTLCPEMTQGGLYNYKDENVVVDGKLITSRGPATAMHFSLTMLEYLFCKEKAIEVGKALLYNYC